MGQHDYDIANQTFPSARSDINSALSAIVSNNSGATEPTTRFAYMLWADTTTGLLKLRNAANSAWITLGELAASGLWLKTYAGNPNTNVAAQFLGQLCLDTSNNRLYVATTATGVAASSVWDSAPFGNHKKRTLSGLIPAYTSNSQITISVGSCYDSTFKYLLDAASPLTLSLASSGTLGLDTGAEAPNTWYYAYLIGKTDGTVSAVFSVTNEAASGTITLPAGYTLKRQLPIALRNDGSSNLIPFIVGEGWPYRPAIVFSNFAMASTYQVLTGGSQTASFTSPGGGTDVNLSAFVPPISRLACLRGVLSYSSSNSTASLKNPDSTSTAGIAVAGVTSVGAPPYFAVKLSTNSSQKVAYMLSTGGADLDLFVEGFVVTEVI
jgi:hypothetical protein